MSRTPKRKTILSITANEKENFYTFIDRKDQDVVPSRRILEVLGIYKIDIIDVNSYWPGDVLLETHIARKDGSASRGRLIRRDQLDIAISMFGINENGITLNSDVFSAKKLMPKDGGSREGVAALLAQSHISLPYRDGFITVDYNTRPISEVLVTPPSIQAEIGVEALAVRM